MKVLSLTTGEGVLVDDALYPYLLQYKWYRSSSPSTGVTYAHTNMNLGHCINKQVAMHRLILGMLHTSSQVLVDHRDHNGLNNQLHNLRRASFRQNIQNKLKKAGFTSRYKGVHLNKKNNKWRACIKHKPGRGHNTHLGYFFDEVQAALTYDSHARKLFGEFARLNFPLPGEDAA